MNQKEEELYELPDWVKLVNRILHGYRKWDEEKQRFERNDSVGESHSKKVA